MTTFTPERTMSLCLVGCGKMGIAMLKGWLAMDRLAHLYVIEPYPAPALTDMAARSGGRLELYHDIGEWAQAKADILVLAVKPQSMPEVLDRLRHVVAGMVVSIAAGRSSGFIAEYMGADVPVLRVMPNTPAAIGEGVSVVYAGAQVVPAMRDVARDLLSVLGDVHFVADEALMDAVTALSGSGPAYVFYLTEVMEAAGVAAGLPPALARDLARKTVTGSAALMQAEAGQSPAELRKAVTSPNGTTQAALEVLMDAEKGIGPVFVDALAAAARRSRELSG